MTATHKELKKDCAETIVKTLQSTDCSELAPISATTTRTVTLYFFLLMPSGASETKHACGDIQAVHLDLPVVRLVHFSRLHVE